MLYAMLTAGAKEGPITIEPGRFYNCSYAMFKGKLPTPKGFDGYHNMLVIKDGMTIKFYNPNESSPAWKEVPKANWKELVDQNDGLHSYVFTGIAVVVP